MENKRSAAHLKVSIFPSGADIPDEADAINLGVLNWEWMHTNRDGLADAIATFFNNSPKDNGNAPREYRNNVCVLVADTDARDRHAGSLQRLSRSQVGSGRPGY